MNLTSVYDSPGLAAHYLFMLLGERRPEESISHRRMPSWQEHQAFVASRPYDAWYLIEDHGSVVGAVNLTRQDEIGVFLFRDHQGRGLGQKAVRMLIEKHPRPRYLANVAPGNGRSIRLWERLQFRHIQNTYELTASEGTPCSISTPATAAL